MVVSCEPSEARRGEAEAEGGGILRERILIWVSETGLKAEVKESFIVAGRGWVGVNCEVGDALPIYPRATGAVKIVWTGSMSRRDYCSYKRDGVVQS